MWAKAKQGLLNAGLYWGIKDQATHEFSSEPGPSFLPDKCHVEDTKDISEMIKMYTSHNNYCYNNDNGLTFDALQ